MLVNNLNILLIIGLYEEFKRVVMALIDVNFSPHASL
jgi:hypothetical protein